MVSTAYVSYLLNEIEVQLVQKHSVDKNESIKYNSCQRIVLQRQFAS